MPKELTVRAIKALKAGRREVPDGAVSGLYLYLDDNGPRSWALRYRRPGNGKSTRLALGTVCLDDAPDPILGGPLSLAGARTVAREQRALIAKGIDPQVAKAEARRDTFGDVLDEYYRAVVPLKRRNRASETKRGWIERDCKDWMDRPIRSIAPRDVRQLINNIVARGSPVQAGNVRDELNPIFSWAWKQELIDENPIAKVDRPVERQSRDRYLDDAELAEVWRATETLGDPWTALAKTLILTGQRLGAVESMRWADVDLDSDEPLWIVPAEVQKMGSAHHVPLAPAVVEMLRGIDRKGDYCFTATGAKLNGRNRFRQRWRKAVNDKRDEPMPDWRPHDLRRTLASGLARLGIPLHVVELVLDHRPRALRGVAAVYQRYDFAAEQRHALETWATHVTSLVGAGAKTNVVPIRA